MFGRKKNNWTVAIERLLNGIQLTVFVFFRSCSIQLAPDNNSSFLLSPKCKSTLYQGRIAPNHGRNSSTMIPFELTGIGKGGVGGWQQTPARLFPKQLQTENTASGCKSRTLEERFFLPLAIFLWSNYRTYPWKRNEDSPLFFSTGITFSSAS